MIVFAVVVSIPIVGFFLYMFGDDFIEGEFLPSEKDLKKFQILITLFFTFTGLALIAGAHIGTCIERYSFQKSLILQVVVSLLGILLFYLIIFTLLYEEVWKGTKFSLEKNIIDYIELWAISLSITVFSSTVTWTLLKYWKKHDI